MEKSRFDRIDDKLEKITDKLENTNKVLAENTASLIIHEKRTDIAEHKLSLLEVEFKKYIERESAVMEQINQKLGPIYTHVNIVNVICKYVIPAIAGILVFLFKMGFIK